MPRAPGLDADRSRSKLWQMLQRSMQPRRCCAVFLGASSHYFTPKSQHLLFVFLPKDCPAMYQFFSKCGALGGAASLENILKLIKSLKPHSRPTEWTPLCVTNPPGVSYAADVGELNHRRPPCGRRTALLRIHVPLCPSRQLSVCVWSWIFKFYFMYFILVPWWDLAEYLTLS